jgi:hypothetical protein
MNKNTQTECFICLNSDKNDIIELKNQSHYTKICDCNGFIHTSCLEKWIQSNIKCPVCRISVETGEQAHARNIEEICELLGYLIRAYLIIYVFFSFL